MDEVDDATITNPSLVEENQQQIQTKQNMKRAKSTEDLEAEEKKKIKKGKIEEQNKPIEIVENQPEDRSAELPLNAKINIRKYWYIKMLGEENIKVIEEFFKYNDLRYV